MMYNIVHTFPKQRTLIITHSNQVGINGHSYVSI